MPQNKASSRRKTNKPQAVGPAHLAIQEHYHEGPLPPPAILKHYDAIVPGAAERIIAMAEGEVTHRRSIEIQQVNADIQTRDHHVEMEMSFAGTNSQIMKGVFLHILADTLGSVGVIISAVLMQMFGWMIADPICSMLIAVLIVLSVISLMKESWEILMQRQPVALDHVLPLCYNKVIQIPGVYSVQEPHFWTLCSDVYVGCLKLEVAREVDPKSVVMTTQKIFQAAGVRQLTVQLDYAPM